MRVVHFETVFRQKEMANKIQTNLTTSLYDIYIIKNII